jgi:hypothetical protein
MWNPIGNQALVEIRSASFVWSAVAGLMCVDNRRLRRLRHLDYKSVVCTEYFWSVFDVAQGL